MAEPRSDTWMPLYIGDYLAATQRLTTEQHGAYFLLLMDYWRNGPPPNDDKIIANIVKISPVSWRKMKPIILAYFTEKSGLLIHNRVERERVRAGEIVEKRRVAGRASAAARAAKQTGQQPPNTRSTHVATNAQHNGKQTGRPLQSQEEEKKAPLDEESNGAGPDSDKVFWDTAKAYLADASKNPGGLIGMWVRDHGKAETAGALTRAQLERPVEKIPFIRGCLKHAGKDGGEGGAPWPC